MDGQLDFVRGDSFGLDCPAYPDAFAAAGAGFLTAAFHAFGAIAPDNAVARVAAIELCPGGSTGAKLFVTVEYARDAPGLHTQLFVKFSRDFTDERRDARGRWEMAPEVPFARVATRPGFPIQVPRPYFADYEEASGTGLVITERVGFGEGRIEPHRRKCLDHLTLPEPLPYYRAVVTALARLCAAHKAGRLATDIDAAFPFDPVSGSADAIVGDAARQEAELESCFAFAARCPQLLPAQVRSPAFHAQMARDAWAIRANEAAIQRFLTSDPAFHALCHWNAHIDNCWFERDDAGTLRCGLIDWGRVGQITLGSVLWGGLSAAHHDIWDHHLPELLALFVHEYHAGGGPAITPEALELHLTLHIAAMGVARVLAFPEVVTFRAPDCALATGPLDAMFEPVPQDPARNSLHIYAVFLKFWRRQDFGAVLERVLASGGTT